MSLIYKIDMPLLLSTK